MEIINKKFNQSVINLFQFIKDSTTVVESYVKAVTFEDKSGQWQFLTKAHTQGAVEFSGLRDCGDKSYAYGDEFIWDDFFNQGDKAEYFREPQICAVLENAAGTKLGYVCLQATEGAAMELSTVRMAQSVDNLSEKLSVLLEWARTEAMVNAINITGNVIGELATLFKQLNFISTDKGGLSYVGREHSSDQLILTAGPSISAKETYYAYDAAKTGWNSKWSGYLTRFEDSFKEFLGVEHAMATSSCTGALHLALMALGIKEGDEVIVPDITWVATASAIRYVGAIPVFVDIQEDSWCIDPKAFAAAITAKTKCVMPVHLYGHPAQMDEVVRIARENNLYIVEDAAPAIGATCNGQKVGSFGDFACFSFQGAKLLVTGEGGMLVSNNKELMTRARAIWDHGRTPGTFWINEVGMKYKMSNVQAAIGLGQIERCDELVEAKRRVFSWYADGLKGEERLRLNFESAWARSIYWMTSIQLKENCGISRDDFIKELRTRNIDSRPVFPKISQYPMWDTFDNPVAQKVGDWAINMPSGVCLSKAEVDYAVEQVKAILDSVK